MTDNNDFRYEPVERFGASNLSDDDPIWPHPQRVANQAADRHLAAALNAGRTPLESDYVAQVES